MDLISSNLQATNEKYNAILSKLESTKSDALANLETTASSATSTISSQLTNVTAELRSLVPEGLTVPNINLQSQLQSLSGLTDITQYNNLLSSITTNFGSALSESGFNLDTLVSDAASAFSLGDSLSGTIPNFEVSSVGDVIQKASAVKVASIDPVIEKAPSVTEQANVTAAKIAATNAVYTTYDELPTEDTGVYKVADKSKKVTQSQGGTAITKEVTTPDQAVEIKKDSNGEETVTRKTVSPKGFSHRRQWYRDKFKLSDLVTVAGGSDELGVDVKVTLTHEPAKIDLIYGYTQEKTPAGKYKSGRTRWSKRFRIISEDGGRKSKYYPNDRFSIGFDNNKEITINQYYRKYDQETNTRYGGDASAITITYYYHENYDPNYAKA